jgi:hypothetical protein
MLVTPDSPSVSGCKHPATVPKGAHQTEEHRFLTAKHVSGQGAQVTGVFRISLTGTLCADATRARSPEAPVYSIWPGPRHGHV